jgi:hypothetical protein
MSKGLEALLPLVAAVVGVTFLAGSFWFWSRGREFRSHGVTARAVVLEKYRKDGEFRLENFYARVSFQDEQARPHEVEVKIISRAWRGLSVGDTTGITYLRDDPEKVDFGPVWGRQIIGAFLIFFMLVSTGLTIAAIGSMISTLLGRSGPAGG